MMSPDPPYDVIIVGGGTAGLVLANRLSEMEELQVIVLESGGDRTTDLNTLTPGAWPMLSSSPDNWLFTTDSEKKDIAKDIAIPQGKALGGSSAINSFLFTSTSKSTLDGWQSLGNDGWDYPAFEQALKRSYTLHRSSGASEGDGPLQLSLATAESQLERAWIDGLQSVGYPATDPLSGRFGGPNIAPESIDPKAQLKQRSFAANAYLTPSVQGRSNLTVETEVTVTKVLLEKSPSSDYARATGVQIISKDGASQTIHARREVIICAGAINSPRLLELSGIGGAELLQQLGIAVVVDNPHVGENLQNHLFTGMVFEVKDEVNTIDAFFRREKAVVEAAQIDYATKGTGPLSTSNMITMAQLPLPEFHTEDGKKELDEMLSSQASTSVASRIPVITPAFAAAHERYVRSILTDPSDAVGNYVFGQAYAPFEHPDPMHREPGKFVSVAIELSHPLSRGSVHITNAHSKLAAENEGVKIDCGYLSHPLDLEVLARQLRFTEDLIARAEPITQHLKPITKRFGDLEEAKRYVRRTADGAYHYTGTCSMMSREMGGVVDSRLRVYGCSNLRVCDSSIVPLEPTAQPQAVVYGVAELAASFIKDDLESL